MKCEFLSERFLRRCEVGLRPYVPSSFEFREYCKTKQHTKCPFYNTRKKAKKDLRGEKTVFSRRGYQAE